MSDQDMNNTVRWPPLFPSCFPRACATRSKPSKPAQAAQPTISRHTSSFSWLPPKSKFMSVTVGSSGGKVEDEACCGACRETGKHEAKKRASCERRNNTHRLRKIFYCQRSENLAGKRNSEMQDGGDVTERSSSSFADSEDIDDSGAGVEEAEAAPSHS